MSKKKILYIDLDGVIVDLKFQYELEFHAGNHSFIDYEKLIDGSETVFLDAPPISSALEAVEELEKHYDVYILSTAPWANTHAWTQKRLWIEKHLPSMYKKLILTHHKQLLIGDYLIDDRTKNGAAEFSGEHIHIFNENSKFPDWDSVLRYLIPNN